MKCLDSFLRNDIIISKCYRIAWLTAGIIKIAYIIAMLMLSIAHMPVNYCNCSILTPFITTSSSHCDVAELPPPNLKISTFAIA